jgi:hypothetical protein
MALLSTPLMAPERLRGIKMAHFAKIENGVVTDIIVISNDQLDEPNKVFPETEKIGQAFIKDVLNLEGEWVQTSINKSFRYNYAGKDGSFDPALGEYGAFIPPKMFPSWTLDETMNWVPPVPYPDNEKPFSWDEENHSWVPLGE